MSCALLRTYRAVFASIYEELCLQNIAGVIAPQGNTIVSVQVIETSFMLLAQ